MEPGSYKNPTERFCELNPIFAKHKALTFTELYVKVLPYLREFCSRVKQLTSI